MNYIKELNAFKDWLLLNELTTSGIALWHTLMSVNNMTGWKEWFTAPNSTLQQLTDLSKQGLSDARNLLIQKNLIEYKKGKRGQAGYYKIISLVNSFDQSLDQTLDQLPDQSLDQSADQNLNIPKRKQNKTNNKQQQPDARERNMTAFELYQNNIQLMPTMIEEEQLIDWINTLGDDFVYKAIEECCKSATSKPTFRFLEYLIKTWTSQGARTPEDIEKLQEEYREKRHLKVLEGGSSDDRRKGGDESRDNEFDRLSL